MTEGDLFKVSFNYQGILIQARLGILNERLVAFNGSVEPFGYRFLVSPIEKIKFLLLESDGNLGLFDESLNVLWQSNTSDKGVVMVSFLIDDMLSMTMNLTAADGSVIKSLSPAKDL